MWRLMFKVPYEHFKQRHQENTVQPPDKLTKLLDSELRQWTGRNASLMAAKPVHLYHKSMHLTGRICDWQPFVHSGCLKGGSQERH